jgi:hypothetical protein
VLLQAATALAVPGARRIAAAVPALCDTALAKAAATVLLTALLRAYQLGARAARIAECTRGN